MKTRIKELRQENNYTQEILAIKIGANQTTLSRIECGLTVTDADIIIKLSDTFQVSTDYILCKSDHRLLSDHSSKVNQPPKSRTQLSPLERLNPCQQAHLLHFLESMMGYY